jgi:xanthine permease XanP
MRGGNPAPSDFLHKRLDVTNSDARLDAEATSVHDFALVLGELGCRSPRRDISHMTPFYALEAKPGPVTTLLCGIQHVLAMFVGIVTPPLILAGALRLSLEQTAFFVSMALFASGVTTFIQVKNIGPLGSGLLSVQGTSFTFVPLAIQSGQAGGLPLILGLTLAAAPAEMVLSRFIHVARRLFPPVVTGPVVMLIGLSLIEVAINDLAGGVGADDYGSAANLCLGAFVAGTIILINRFGSGFLRTSSIALGLVAGYVLAAFLGRVDLSVTQRAGWFMLPRPFQFGLAFDPVFLFPWLVGYLVTTIESIGDLTATSAVSREPVEGPTFIRRLQGGILADGFGSFIAGVFNSMPNTTFSQNNGVVSLTGVAARRVGYAVAALLISLGLFPKLAALVGLMPRPVLGGATVVLFSMVTIAGLRIVTSGGWTYRSEIIVAISLSLGLGVSMVPEWVTLLDRASDHAVVAIALSSLKVVLASGLSVGAIAATLLNLLLPPLEPALAEAEAARSFPDS